MSEATVGIIVLAAGASSRMGEPKGLLAFEGETLIKRAVRAALGTGCRPVIVVLGSNASALHDEIAETDALVLFNRNWFEGMSSSIRCGIETLEGCAQDKPEAVILTLCDQPFVTSACLRRLIDSYRASGAALVASEYEAAGEKTFGVPALFSRALFSELMSLSGAEGAKRVIMRHRQEAAVVALPEAAFDVDTPDDYLALRDKAEGRIM